MSHHCEDETHNTGKPEWISCHDRRSRPLMSRLSVLVVSCLVVTLQCWPKSCRPAANSWPHTNIKYNRKMRKCVVFFTSLFLAVINLKIMVCKQQVFYIFLTVHLRVILVGNQFDARFLLWQVYLNPLHASSNSVLVLRRTTVLIHLV
jgi:hypothetical protein